MKGNVPIKDLEYTVVIHDDPKEKTKEKTLHQPYQYAIQLLDSGKNVKKGDEMHFIKVQPFNHKGKKFTVKPIDQIKKISEINMLDYIRNMKTALNQTFKPMNISFSEQNKSERTLFDFIS